MKRIQTILLFGIIMVSQSLSAAEVCIDQYDEEIQTFNRICTTFEYTNSGTGAGSGSGAASGSGYAGDPSEYDLRHALCEAECRDIWYSYDRMICMDSCMAAGGF